MKPIDIAEVLARNRVDPEQILHGGAMDGAAAAAVPGDEPADLPDSFRPSILTNDDGSTPLADARVEMFVGAIVAGMQAPLAYITYVSGQCSRKSAEQQASRVRRRPDVAARLSYLIREKIRADKRTGRNVGMPGGQGTGAGSGSGSDPDSAGMDTSDEAGSGRSGAFSESAGLTKSEKLAICEEVARNPMATIPDRMRAIEAHNRLQADNQNAKRLADLDPVELCAFLRAAADQGLDPVELAAKRRERAAGIKPVPKVAKVTESETEKCIKPQPVDDACDTSVADVALLCRNVQVYRGFTAQDV